jgi:hypothetical protein
LTQQSTMGIGGRQKPVWNRKQKPGAVVHTCNLSYSGSRGRRIAAWG